MAEVLLTKGQDGKLAGLTDSDDRRWRKFLARLKTLQFGDTVKAEFRLPRSPGLHRRHFAILKAVFDQQEQFEDFDGFRQWVQVGAGFCDLMPGPKGKPVAIVRSIAWDRLEDADFAEHHLEVVKFLRSTYCTRFLWPQRDDLDADTFINTILREFE